MTTARGKARGEPPKGKGRLKREATEAALVKAFGRVVQRSGLRNVGVNEVIKEAGVGKALLYRYFGGLPGLVRAWGEKNRIWPDLSELMELSDSLEAARPSERLKRIVIHNANSHRADPVRVELLADEIMTPTQISDALSEIRQQLGKEHAAVFKRNRNIQQHRMLLVILIAAASYLAMRAVKSPRFMGEDLASEETWNRMLREMELIIDRVVDGK